MNQPTDDATEAAARRLEWTQERPTKPGAYLYAFGPTGIQMLWLTFNIKRQEWYAVQGGLALDVESYFEEVLWWLGPLSIPEIPE